MRGITPVVATVLLLAIVVVAALGIYYWTSIYSSQPSTSNPPAWIAASPVGKGKVLIANLGRTEINTSEFRTSDPGVNVTCEDAVLNPGEQTVCSLTGSPSSSTVVIFGAGTTSISVSSEYVNESSGGSGGSGGSSGSNLPNSDSTSIYEWRMFHRYLNHTGYNPLGPGDSLKDMVVYVGSYDGKMYALNASTGEKIWNYTTGDSVYSSPAVVKWPS